jgi:hypothetical protein
MTVEAWMAWALADADRRNLPELKPLLEGLAGAMRVLRSGHLNDRADEQPHTRTDD